MELEQKLQITQNIFPPTPFNISLLVSMLLFSFGKGKNGSRRKKEKPLNGILLVFFFFCKEFSSGANASPSGDFTFI